jgi:hypothetical protein
MDRGRTASAEVPFAVDADNLRSPGDRGLFVLPFPVDADNLRPPGERGLFVLPFAVDADDLRSPGERGLFVEGRRRVSRELFEELGLVTAPSRGDARVASLDTDISLHR